MGNSLIFGGNSKISHELYKVLLNHNHKITFISRKFPDWANPEFNKYIEFKDLRDVTAIENKLMGAKFDHLFFVGSPWSNKLIHNLNREEIYDFLENGIGNQLNIISLSLVEMAKNNFGRIIFIGSAISDAGFPGSCLYSLVKHSYKQIVKSIAIEYGEFGITANVLNLGLLKEGLNENLSKSKIWEIEKRTSSKSKIEAKAIAQLIIFIIKDKNINGAVVPYHGGFF